MKHLFSFCLFSLFSFQLFAQGGTIVSFTLNPANPIEGDDVEVYAEVSFPYSGCDLDFIAYPLNGTNISATAHHCIGLLAAICNTTDTFELGQLPAGDYTLDLTLTSGSGGPNCTPGIVADDNDQFQFTVSPAVGVEELESLKDLIYPNPFVQELNFKSPLAESALITDINGKIVVEIDAGAISIDLKALPSGVYLFRIGRKVHKLVKQ